MLLTHLLLRHLLSLVLVLVTTAGEGLGLGDEEAAGISKQVKLFQSLFKERRTEHKSAIRTMLELGSPVKQQKMASVIAAKIFEVLGKKQVVLREAGYLPGMDFPDDENVRDALSQTLDNTAFFGEILLHLPDITHEILRQNRPWQLLLTWGVFFATQSKFLDNATAKFIYLVSQELGLTERDPNYTNPYVRQDHKRPLMEAAAAGGGNKGKKKKTFKKGPQLSRQFGDL
ncbi:hypothetical protein Pmani_011908 [Petrolisthes manimaculis]|uniref:Coiled-coil domain-containing protein 134 n=1 Tax=Petrolisthes manimaculis TaxID=1843537 RepID=A0AAE1Q204_9EUCA|nr:hypothetical protein Pmani_011908 [Petrolisthes manimaculis]